MLDWVLQLKTMLDESLADDIYISNLLTYPPYIKAIPTTLVTNRELYSKFNYNMPLNSTSIPYILL
jgi:hypothetical protein